jgi:hypothetical protein
MRQRGIRKQDVDLLLSYGTQIDDAAIILTDQDASREIERRKHEIQALERLRGSKIVVADGALVTCYHAKARHVKRALRQRY